MRAKLKEIVSADVDFDSYQPKDATCFSFPIEMVIGPEHTESGDLFQMDVCTPEWIRKEYGEQHVAVTGFPLLLVFEYDWPKILTHLEHLIGSYTADNWDDLSLKLSRLAVWEFMDYQP